MALPFFIFWALIILGRGELGWRGVGVCVVIWGLLLAGFLYLNISPQLFVAAQAFFDCILILVIFKGDIVIR
jgi:hypothetical protein